MKKLQLIRSLKKIFISMMITFMFVSAFGQSDPELSKEYPKAQEEVRQVIMNIEQYIRNNQVDELIATHAYGPKFTEFELGGKRQGPKENEDFERNFLGNITEVEKWEWNDLKINVYGGDVANATYHAHYKFCIGKENYEFKMQGTLLFIKTKQGWKITHEHQAPLSTEE